MPSIPDGGSTLEHDVVADLPATAVVISDPAERRQVLATFVEQSNAPHGADSLWPRAELDEWVEGSPLARVEFSEATDAAARIARDRRRT